MANAKHQYTTKSFPTRDGNPVYKLFSSDGNKYEPWSIPFDNAKLGILSNKLSSHELCDYNWPSLKEHMDNLLEEGLKKPIPLTDVEASAVALYAFDLAEFQRTVGALIRVSSMRRPSSIECLAMLSGSSMNVTPHNSPHTNAPFFVGPGHDGVVLLSPKATPRKSFCGHFRSSTPQEVVEKSSDASQSSLQGGQGRPRATAILSEGKKSILDGGGAETLDSKASKSEVGTRISRSRTAPPGAGARNFS